MGKTRKQRGGDLNYVSIEDLITAVRSTQPPAVLEDYEPTKAQCPHCKTERKLVKGTPVITRNICKDECLKKNIKEMVLDSNELAYLLLKTIALKRGLGNGETLKFDWEGYRNHGLYFWDAQNEEIVPPFTEIDDYGSVPPRFVVGDGYFNPTDWLDEVEHNAYVFPSRTLIKEIKAFVDTHAKEKKMIVEINGVEYLVLTKSCNNCRWDSIVLEVIRGGKMTWLEVHNGDPKWRKSIVEDKPENNNAAHGALLALAAKHAKGREGNNVIRGLVPNRGGRKTRRRN